MLNHVLKLNSFNTEMGGNMGKALSKVALENKQHNYQELDWLVLELSSYQIEGSPNLKPTIERKFLLEVSCHFIGCTDFLVGISSRTRLRHLMHYLGLVGLPIFPCHPSRDTIAYHLSPSLS